MTIPTDAELSAAYSQGYSDALRCVRDNPNHEGDTMHDKTAKPQASRTPGPWSIGEAFNPERACAIVTPWQDGEERGEETIAEVCDGPNGQGQIDANFIVTACNAYDRDQQTIRDLAAALRDCESLLHSRFSSPGTQEGRLAVAMVNRIRGLLLP